MKDRFGIISLEKLTKLLLDHYEHGRSILGLSPGLFFRPSPADPFRSLHLGRSLETPIGVAAGPHTQLAQNIVVAWLAGARFIELKTVQTLDELDISKPCIDMQDEGYNCEWSQELKITESFDQYLNAWILIHILRHKMGLDDPAGPGMMFNMSVGYDLKGILSEKVQWYLDQMADASLALEEKLVQISAIYPEVNKLSISPRLSDNITLSTMHGCPPDEIEKIATYLIGERQLHTTIKMNPTLLGKNEVLDIVRHSGFDSQIPDIAFEHDLKFEPAVEMIRRLKQKAEKHGLQFSIKLTNTLESVNHKEVFPPKEQMMYLSGRALHPIAVRLAARLQQAFNGSLHISFSGGADTFNIRDLLQCGLTPVTVCSDLLKPGGYGRLHQYIEAIRTDSFSDEQQTKWQYLQDYARKVLEMDRYKKTSLTDPDIKTHRKLGFFDCIHAPCEDTCPTHQDIPSYLHFAARGDYDKAAEVIRRTNPFPLTTGMICDHLCQTKCVRIHYDSPVLIREVKRYIAEHSINTAGRILDNDDLPWKKVAIIGAGPSGLSCAWFLAFNGIDVDVYESGSRPGGMVSGAIPAFRLTAEAIETDVAQIEKMGVKIHYDAPIDEARFSDLRNEVDYIYIAAGAHRSVQLQLKGMESEGVLDPLEFLTAVKRGEKMNIGRQVVIIGGGNTAMDAARTAWRLVGKEGKVTIVYRRTIRQMPADQGEIRAVMEEGVDILELSSPIEIHSGQGHITGISCQQMELGAKDGTGRPKPVPIPGAIFRIEADTLIPAIGQEKAFDFVDTTLLTTEGDSYETLIPGVFIGGDALRGASTAINAIGDGRKAAAEILKKAGITNIFPRQPDREPEDPQTLMRKKAWREQGPKPIERSVASRKDFKLVSTTLSEEEVIREAGRCLKCDEVCSICTTVCPNLAFHAYPIDPVELHPGRIERRGHSYSVASGDLFKIKQAIQILHLADWCNECGNCTTFCPSAGSPFRDKPHLYFLKENFLSEKDGYFLSLEKGIPALQCFIDGTLHTLLETDEHLMYKSEGFRVYLDKDSLQLRHAEFLKEEIQQIDLQPVARMRTLMQGANDFLHLY